DHRRTNAVFLPQVELSYTAFTTNNPLMAFGSKLNQEAVTAQDFNPALLNDPDQIENFATEIAVNQPILNFDGIYQRSAANAKMEAVNKKRERIRDGMRLELKKNYNSLQLSYESLVVIKKAEALAEEGLNMIKDYFEEGLVKKADLLQAELQLQYLQTKEASVKKQIVELSMLLSYLIDEERIDLIYKPKEALDTNYNPITEKVLLNEDRADISAMYDAAEAYKKMSTASKMSFLPRLNAFGRYQMYDDEFLQADANGFLIGARLSWSLFSGYDRIAQSEKAKIKYLKASHEADQYLSKSRLELAKTTEHLRLLEFKIKQQKIIIEQAREAYKIRKDRFSEGLEKTTDLLESELTLFQSEFEAKQLLFEYNLTKAYLNFLSI
ncbi:MAG: transporter, partial [Flavobacteriales bacterium]|nr:transporter [Flavobacteriales bacterium]